jgi:hypothetical protein
MASEFPRVIDAEIGRGDHGTRFDSEARKPRRRDPGFMPSEFVISGSRWQPAKNGS